MERTQVYIEAAQRMELARIAKRRGTTVSQLVREGITTVIERESKPLPLGRIEDHPLWGLVGMIKESDGPTDSAENHDKYIYGRDIEGGR